MVWVMPVYTISDPRQIILKGAVQKLAKAEGYDEDFELYERVEKTCSAGYRQKA